ncbi:MAG: potassium transporter Kup [Phycisphaerae bacterium]|nr:potassium transporter Kup [Gemmatimonadaceae bacterium]
MPTNTSAQSDAGHGSVNKSLALMGIAAMGVVFGDLGTSPLYALQDAFVGAHGMAATRENVLGVVSLFVWSLVLVVCIKYLAVVMRADNNGEGGILALLALAITPRAGEPADKQPKRERHAGLFLLGVLGATLLYGDGAITPAISVLSAVEGLKIATTAFAPAVVPITIVIIVALFAVQSRGTALIGKVFGPVLLLWFIAIAAVGVRALLLQPDILQSLDPRWGVRFFAAHGWSGFPVLGAVVLCLTGGEALYADMGHFGKRPIRFAWFTVAFPALVLSYLGQGATMLLLPETASNPFYRSTPAPLLYPMVALATAATVIASQALISAVFSLTRQAMQLGLTPRLRVIHTSAHEIGQVYLPSVNWALMIACLALVVGFGSAARLAAAFGLAVSGTMTVTTILFAAVARRTWGWSAGLTAVVAGSFLLLDLAFLGANLLKLFDGGWIPLVFAAVIGTFLLTWRKGRSLLATAAGERALTTDAVAAVMDSLTQGTVARVAGTAVFLDARREGLPRTFLHNLKHNRVMHARTIFLTIETALVPLVADNERVAVTEVAPSTWRVVARYGFMEEANVATVLELATGRGVQFDKAETTYFLGRETVLSSARPGMARWRERLFGVMLRNSQPASAFFQLPPNRVVELGAQVEI